MKRIKLLFLAMSATFVLVACGSGPSTKCKTLYDEKMENHLRDAEVIKGILESNGESIPQPLGTSFFHLTESEQKTWDKCVWDDEMAANLRTAEAVSMDVDRVTSAIPNYLDKFESKEAEEEAYAKLKKIVDDILKNYTLEELELKTYSDK